MIINMSTKIKQNIIIIDSKLHETRQNKCWCKIALNIQEGLMGVKIKKKKKMLNDRPTKHDYRGQSIIILYKDWLSHPSLRVCYIQIPEISIGVLAKISTFQLEWVGFENTLTWLSGVLW